MNLSAAVFLISDEVRAIGVIFNQMNVTNNYNEKEYVYKSLDQSIKEGDLVVVPTGANNELKVVRVVNVEAEIRHDVQIDYKWIVAKVDNTQVQRILDRERKAVEEIRRVQRKAKREQLRKEFVEFGGDEIAKIAFNPVVDVPDEQA